MTRRLPTLLGVFVMSLAAGPAAAQPPAPDLDRVALDTLKVVHNQGADLYNTGDAAGAYRMYQGALVTVRPFLAHRPAVQKIIDNGMNEVAKSSGVKIQAFRLHEVIEQVRAELKVEVKKAEAAKTGPPTAVVPSPPKETVSTPLPKPADPPKPKPMAETPKDPMPPVKPKPPEPPAAKDGAVSGRATVAGKPLDGEVTFLSLDLPVPRIFSAAVKEGSYKVAGDLPPGRYVVMATGTGVPAKFQTVGTSGLTVEVKAGGNTLDFDLK